MLIYHDSGAAVLAHDGIDYTADQDARIRDASGAIIDVPAFEMDEPVALAVARFAGWHVYTGPPEATEAEEAIAEKEALERRVADLEAQIAELAKTKSRAKS